MTKEKQFKKAKRHLNVERKLHRIMPRRKKKLEILSEWGEVFASFHSKNLSIELFVWSSERNVDNSGKNFAFPPSSISSRYLANCQESSTASGGLSTGIIVSVLTFARWHFRLFIHLFWIFHISQLNLFISILYLPVAILVTIVSNICFFFFISVKKVFFDFMSMMKTGPNKQLFSLKILRWTSSELCFRASLLFLRSQLIHIELRGFCTSSIVPMQRDSGTQQNCHVIVTLN